MPNLNAFSALSLGAEPCSDDVLVLSTIEQATEARFAFSDYDEKAGEFSFADPEDGPAASGPLHALYALGTGIEGGCRVLTADGLRRCDELRNGDLVMTRNGLQPVLWVGHRHLQWRVLGLAPQLRPSRIAAGTLGGGLPEADLSLAPMQRIVADPSLSEICGKDLATRSAGLEPVSACNYVQILFADTEAMLVEGVWLQSYVPTRQNIGLLADDDRMEILFHKRHLLG
ncbi:Hint domain-containing protein [Thioclava litoralis]|uniref:Hint domain-containing protein n=1 Tax=Thioclava litoralis TaxID=3076557 RepID=A0ABZ1E0I2_9RHOB|nr:Hint domain-containing protein [Thioclava sp. FTW29]